MALGESVNTGRELTDDSAVSAFESLLSVAPATEHAEDREAPQPSEEADESAEGTASSDESDDSAAADSDEVASGDDESEAASPEPRKFRVKVDGEELEVTEDELLKGYSRTADYTRKAQALAEQRKQFESTEAAAVRAERAQLAEQLTQYRQRLESLTPQEPDWDTIRRDHPDEYPALHADWQRHKEYLQTVQRQEAEARHRADADRQAAMQHHLTAEQQKLLAAIPEWKDADKAKAEKKQLVEFATSLGYTEQDLAGITDHRLVLVLRNAMRFQQQQTKAPEIRKTVEKVKAATPAPRGSSKPVSDLTRAKQRLAKTHDDESAAKVFEHIL